MKGDILIVKAVRVTPVLDVRKEEVLSMGYICIKYGAYHKLKACPICHFKIKKPCLNENLIAWMNGLYHSYQILL